MKQFLFFVVASTLIFSFSSCRKKKDTLANIYIRDEMDNPVEDATVILYGTPTGNPVGTDTPGLVNLRDTVQTNSSGLAVFNLSEVYQSGQAGVAILDIKAYKLNRLGEGIIKIEPETINEQTVFIQP
jgi:hypothetical protein